MYLRVTSCIVIIIVIMTVNVSFFDSQFLHFTDRFQKIDIFYLTLYLGEDTLKSPTSETVIRLTIKSSVLVFL